MRTESTDGSIHDLTDAEAAALRDLCERMLKGPVDLTHPLYVQWADACNVDADRRLLATVAFLPRALHALLVRERAACVAEIDKEIATVKATALLSHESRSGALAFLGYARKHILERNA